MADTPARRTLRTLLLGGPGA
eukprot:COSAG06_NODE_64935_length_258_cov_0.654088_1_plen_20_part_01